LDTFKFYSGEGGIRSPMIISGVAGAAHNQIHDGLTHVTDILPTLLDVAQVARPGASYQGQPIEAPTGHSLLPVLANPAMRVRAADEPLGYELSGNKALFKGRPEDRAEQPADWRRAMAPVRPAHRPGRDE
jgi:arylsulfatase A-like enzyme